jgi:prepilin-type processing-associated H-X9-DG protein
VVIGIIAVLLSLLLPGINTVRRSAQSVQCRSNLGQISASIRLFALEHDGFSVGSAHRSAPTGASITWQNILSVEYFKDDNYVPRLGMNSSSKLYCSTAMQDQVSTNRSYALNSGSVGGPALRIPTDTNRLLPLYKKGTPAIVFDAYNLGIRLDKVNRPNQKLMVIDTDRGDGFSANGALVLGDDPGFWKWSAGAGVYSFRHLGTTLNASYFDGHAENIKYAPGVGATKYVQIGF